MSKQQVKKATEILGKITTVDEKTWILPSKSDESKTHTVQIINNEYQVQSIDVE